MKLITDLQTSCKVLDLPSSVVATVPSFSEPSTGSYKAAVDHFLQTGSGKDLTTQKQEEMSLPDVLESQTRSLQQLLGSAKSLTAREDLLSTLRSDRVMFIQLFT